MIPDLGKMAHISQLIAQAAGDPALLQELAKKAAETGVDPDELQAQTQSQTGGSNMAGASLGSVMAPTAQAAAGAGGGFDPNTIGLALQGVQALQPTALPQAGVPGLRAGGIAQNPLMQLLLQSILQNNQGQQPQNAGPGLGALIAGR